MLSRRRSVRLGQFSLAIILWTTLHTEWASGTRGSPDFTPSSYQFTLPKIPFTGAPIDMGTTLVAIKYSGGVVLGADTRTSTGGYVSNKLAYKINILLSTTSSSNNNSNLLDGTESSPQTSTTTTTTPLGTTSCVLCRSGSAADTQWVATQTRHKFLTRQLERPTYVPSISQIAHYIRHLLRQTKQQVSSSSGPLQASLICAGYDDQDGCGSGSGSGKIYAITPGGSLLVEDHFCVSGSGSTLLLGYLDSLDPSELTSYNKDEAVALVTKLLRLSIARDGSSGGLVRIVVVNKEGVEELTVNPDDTSKLGEKNFVAKLEGFVDATQ
ncbi:proteasome subunit [Nitzschia inconspicua]|uniref:Proteasome subunit n=1 Tax=Nitzschia inconspicua TaxID=303405 RepID=A0A9K3M6E9_9STRA|nr:proteasome subunit [Nitzschia inconspicua]